METTKQIPYGHIFIFCLIFMSTSAAMATTISGKVMIKWSSRLTTIEVETGTAIILGTNCFSKIKKGSFHFPCNLNSKDKNRKEYTLRIIYPFNQRMYLFDHTVYSNPRLQYYKHDFINTRAIFNGFHLLPYSHQVNMTPDELWAMNQKDRMSLLSQKPAIFKFETVSDICLSPKWMDMELDEEEFVSNLYLRYDQSDEGNSKNIFKKGLSISQKIAASYLAGARVEVCVKTDVILASHHGHMTVYGFKTEIERQKDQIIFTSY